MEDSIFKRLTKKVKYYAGEVGKQKTGVHAAGIAFYFFISVIPFAVLICSQLPYTGIKCGDLVRVATQITPDPVDNLVATLIKEAYTSKVGVFSISIITLLWASSKVITTMTRSLDSIYDVKETRNYFVRLGYSVLYTVVIVIGTGSLIVLAFRGRSAEQLVASLFSRKELFALFKKASRNFLLYAVGVVIFSLFYKFFPSGKRKFLKQLPGAAAAMVGIGVFTALFALYYSKRGVYQSFYGSLAAIALFLLWIYFCMNIFLLGAVLNSLLFKKREKKNTEEKEEEKALTEAEE